MENDVTLMRQLLALGETIEGLKAESSRSRRSSLVSLSDEDDAIDVETDHEMVSGTVTQLLVNEDPSPFPPRKQYFSRKNSVLRIPIPPCHKHHNPRALRSPAGNSYNSTDDDVSSGVSSASSRRSEDSGSRQQHETRDKLSPLFSPNSSFCSARKITPSQRKGHDSNVSIDSGIRLSSPPHSPSHSDLDDNGVKEQEEEVFV
uniref:Uncharacterized protein n=1 Tax=Plectus sambesii TaxID=2011161 RepID=A0A914VZ32_9BILA